MFGFVYQMVSQVFFENSADYRNAPPELRPLAQLGLLICFTGMALMFGWICLGAALPEINIFDIFRPFGHPLGLWGVVMAGVGLCFS